MRDPYEVLGIQRGASAVSYTHLFYLNGQRVELRGLNRHQSYAYQGYAMPDSIQQLDVYKRQGGRRPPQTPGSGG